MRAQVGIVVFVVNVIRSPSCGSPTSTTPCSSTGPARSRGSISRDAPCVHQPCLLEQRTYGRASVRAARPATCSGKGDGEVSIPKPRRPRPDVLDSVHRVAASSRSGAASARVSARRARRAQESGSAAGRSRRRNRMPDRRGGADATRHGTPVWSPTPRRRSASRLVRCPCVVTGAWDALELFQAALERAHGLDEARAGSEASPRCARREGAGPGCRTCAPHK